MPAARRAAQEFNPDAVHRLSSLLSDMADPDRLAIVVCLRSGARTLEDTCGVTGLAAPSVLGHIARLSTRGLVKSTQRRGTLTYQLARPELVDWLLDGTSALSAEEPSR